MKICYIANSSSSHTVKWANYFKDLGNEVHIISHSDTQVPGINVHYIDYSIRNFLFKVKEVHNKIKEINPDIIHAQQANTCGLYATTMKGYKVIVSAWGSDILVAPTTSFIMKKIVQYVIKHAEFITSDSFYMSKVIVNLGGKEDKIYTFPMGVEDILLNYKHVYSDKDEFKIISTRRLEKMYKVDVIIKGFYKALKEYPKMHLKVAAGGTELDNLKGITKELRIENNVTFIGPYFPLDIGKILEENDAFISVPESDSTSVSLLESMGVGIFPIVSDLPANREWVNHKDNGYIINDINEDAVKDAILWCINNEKHLSEVAEKNINTIKEKALWKNNAKIVENLYKKVLK